MTGLERLRKVADRMRERELILIPRHYGVVLNDIADQIEREHAQTCEDHERQQEIIRDLQRERDEALREAKWVREHGGLEELRKMARLALKGEVESHAVKALRKLAGVGHEEAVSIAFMIESIQARLMPTGMEWPRYESGELVEIGATFAEKGTIENVAASVELSEDWFAVHGFDGAVSEYSSGERVKRPEPAPVGADGLPIKNEEIVYDKDTGERFEVDGFSRGYVVCYDIDLCEADIEISPSQLTHTKPEPKLLCKDCEYWQKDPTADRMGTCWFYYSAVDGDDYYRACTCEEFSARDKPEPPDSWDRWRRDMLRPLTRYVENIMGEDITAFEYVDLADMATRHMERRAKALADLERGE